MFGYVHLWNRFKKSDERLEAECAKEGDSGATVWLGQGWQLKGAGWLRGSEWKAFTQAVPDTFLSLVPTTENLAKAWVIEG